MNPSGSIEGESTQCRGVCFTIAKRSLSGQGLGGEKFTDSSFRYFNNQAKKSLPVMLVTGSEKKKKKVCWA